MASNTQVVTAFIVRPNGEPFTKGIIKFELTGVDTDLTEVVASGKSVQFPIESDGSIAADLWSNIRGNAGSFYFVRVREDGAGNFETIGRIQVPDNGPYDLATLMRADVPAAQKTFYSVLTQAEYDVFIDLMNAKLSDMDGKLVTGSGYVDAALDHKNEAAASAALALGYKDDVATIAATVAGVPVGGTVGQVLAKIDSTNYNTTWVDQLPVGGGTAWGDIAGTLTDQTDLNAALDAKAATSHTHTISQITDFNSGDYATYAQGALADTAVQDGATLSGGFTSTIDDDGTQSSGTYTPSLDSGSNYKKIINGGAFALSAPTLTTGQATTISLFVTNNGSAGAITATGFSKVSGDAFSIISGDDFLCRIEVFHIGGVEYSFLNVVALQ